MARGTKQQLSTPAQAEIIGELHDTLGKDYKTIAKTLGINRNTAMKYAKIQNPEEWHEFGKNVQKIIAVNEEKLMASVLKKLKDELPDAKYSEAVDVYKSLKESKNNKTSQVNIAGNEMKVEFIQA